MTTTTLQRCTRCGMRPDALVHNATANGHDFTVDRTKLPTCPPWCSGHDDLGYQSWEDLAVDGVRRTDAIREHSARTSVYGPGEVALGQTERSDGTWKAPHVEVYVNGSGELTEAQAHELGLALVRAGDAIRRSQR